MTGEPATLEILINLTPWPKY